MHTIAISKYLNPPIPWQWVHNDPIAQEDQSTLVCSTQAALMVTKSCRLRLWQGTRAPPLL